MEGGCRTASSGRYFAGELSQVLWNLLMNACQAVPADGGIFVGARLIRQRIPGRLDRSQGPRHRPGHPGTESAKIFEPFFTTKDRGTGLGLSIVQKIISDRGDGSG